MRTAESWSGPGRRPWLRRRRHAQPPQPHPIRNRQALALAEELGMRPLLAHGHRGLGTLYATVGQRAQARTALTTAIELYRTMDMTFWLPQAEAALARKGHDRL